jgi:hypothetical protein
VFSSVFSCLPFDCLSSAVLLNFKKSLICLSGQWWHSHHCPYPFPRVQWSRFCYCFLANLLFILMRWLYITFFILLFWNLCLLKLIWIHRTSNV